MLNNPRWTRAENKFKKFKFLSLINLAKLKSTSYMQVYYLFTEYREIQLRHISWGADGKLICHEKLFLQGMSSLSFNDYFLKVLIIT